jgi:uncharacterized Tic20 family protein
MTDDPTQPSSGAAPDAPTQDERNMAMLAHLLAIVLGFIGPLIIWLVKKDSSEYVDDQGKEALNFNILMTIAYAVCGVLTCVVIGAFLLPLVWIVNIVFAILGGVAANRGERYRYPFNWRLLT